VLSERELNRAVLARQLLLERRRVALPAALERVGGIQAQYAPSMYIGLWSRLGNLRRDALTRALERRTVVQATLMRVTIHLVSRADYWPLTDAVRDERRVRWLRGRQKTGPSEPEVERAAELMRARLDEGPAGRAELLEMAGGDSRLLNGATLWLDVVRVPPSGTWDHRRADMYALAESWLGRDRAERPVDHLVLRYLRAFGPAPVTDLADWAGLATGAVKPAVERLRLRRFRDEQDRVLLDVPRGLLPDPSTPAPARFLPTWDATLLVNVRRAGILPERFRPLLFSTKTPQSKPSFTVDGAVAGSWREEKGRVRIEPFEPLPRTARREVEDEAGRLEAFIS
jgi:hypothetical protein